MWETLNICTAPTAVVLATKKYNPKSNPGTIFELKFVRFLILSRNFIKNQNIYLANMAELLATEKCNHYGTTFEIEFVCLWTSSVQKLAQIKIRDVYFILLMFKFSMF